MLEIPNKLVQDFFYREAFELSPKDQKLKQKY